MEPTSCRPVELREVIEDWPVGPQGIQIEWQSLADIHSLCLALILNHLF